MATAKKDAGEPVEERQPMKEPQGGWPPDEFTGKGGSYIRDPFTGVRRPAEQPATDQPNAA